MKLFTIELLQFKHRQVILLVIQITPLILIYQLNLILIVFYEFLFLKKISSREWD